MVLQTETTSLLDDPEPPFLQEPTVLVDQEPPAPAFDQLVDTVYHWRLVLAVGLVPLFLAAMALSFRDSPPTDDSGSRAAVGDEVTGDNAVSAFEAMIQDVVPADTDQEGGASAPSSIPALPSPATTDGTGATTETSAPTSSVAETSVVETTSPPTTEPPTTAPPTTIVQCLVSVRRGTALRAGPDGDTERLDRVSRGLYGGFEVSGDGEWYRIDYQGTIGWINERSVDGTQGSC